MKRACDLTVARPFLILVVMCESGSSFDAIYVAIQVLRHLHLEAPNSSLC